MPAESGSPGGRIHPHPGFFLVLDGPDGGGKTTQAARLADWLRERGFDVVACRDPGGTALGNRLRSILLDRHAVPISIRAEMLLYMASRAQMVEEVIRPALEPGTSWSATGSCWRPSCTRDMPAAWIPSRRSRPSAKAATGGPFPDLTIVLDVDLATSPEAGSGRRVTGSRIGRRIITSGSARAISRPRAAAQAAPGCRCVIRADRPGRRDGRSGCGIRGDQERGGACPGTRSAAMTASWRSCGGASSTAGSPTRCCSSGRRGSASGPSREAGAGPAVRDSPRRGTRPLRGLSRLPPGRGRHPPRFRRSRPARGQARAADRRDPRPLRALRPEAGARHAQGGDPRRRRRPQRRGGQRVPEDAGGAAAGRGADPDRHVGRGPAPDDRLAVSGRPVRPAAGGRRRRAAAGEGVWPATPPMRTGSPRWATAA